MSRLLLIHDAQRKLPESQRPRGPEGQREIREAECLARRSALAFRRWLRKFGFGIERAADFLDLSTRTLADWEHDWNHDHLAVQPRGRTARIADEPTRDRVIEYLGQAGTHTGVPTVQAQFPDLARREVADIVRHFKNQQSEEEREELHTVQWKRPGTVWATDFSYPPCDIDNRYPYMLAVRDLASGYQLLWLPTADATAQTARDALAVLFAVHGPPLVLKSDNGSHFIGDPFPKLLEDNSVWPLLSPVRLPSYNGSIEASNRWMKIRTEHQAMNHDRPGIWTSTDLQAARLVANRTTRPYGPAGPTPEDLWLAGPPIDDQLRRDFTARTVRYQQEELLEHGQKKDQLGRAELARIGRIVARRALGAYDLFEVWRRPITLPIND